MSDAEPKHKFSKYHLADIGITICCYAGQNAALPYPIKITHNRNLAYEKCGPSKRRQIKGFEQRPSLKIGCHLDLFIWATAFLMPQCAFIN